MIPRDGRLSWCRHVVPALSVRRSRFYVSYSNLLDPITFMHSERGIRTLDRGLTYTPLAGERLQPLGHLSGSAHCNVKVLVVVDEIWALSGDLCGKI